jgi:diguanylate cyclase (GGDEF)-like protein/PAS domain S-box-containing protein
MAGLLPPASANRPDTAMRGRVHAQTVRLLYRFAPVGLLVTLLVLFILGAILWEDLARRALFGWFGIALTLMVVRYILYKTFTNLSPPDEQLPLWERRFVVVTLVMACAWAVLGTFLLPTDLVPRLAVVMLTSLLATGAVAYAAPHPWLFRVEAFLILVPLAVQLAMSGDRTQLAISAALLILAGLLPVVHTKVSKGLTEALSTEFDKALISERLKEEKSRVLEMNSALAEEVMSRLKAEQRQLIAAQKLRMHVERTPLGVIELDRSLTIVDWNPAAEGIFGIAADEAIGRSLADLVIPESSREAYQNAWAEVETSGEGAQVTLSCTTRVGRNIHAEFHLAPLTDSEGRVLAFGCLVQDVTERLNTERTIHFMAHHDALTGLPNRRLLQDRLNQAIMQARRTRRYVAVLFLDLDRFKFVNDTLGHDTGDYILKDVARRLQGAIRAGDTVAREGGDEFIVLLPDLDKPESAKLVADKIVQTLAAPFDSGGQELHVTTSIGISYFPNDATDVQQLLKHADSAMYQAKEAGRNTVRFYTSDLNFLLQKRMEVESKLRRALEQNEFRLRYQPLIDVNTGKLLGFEALLRWMDPQMGEIYPGDFLYITEELGLIIPLGDWVFASVCAQLNQWQANGLPPVTVSINLSPRQFMSRRIVPSMEKILAATGANPACIELEVSETLLMRNLEQSIERLQEFAQLKLRVTIDDFGVGYSSLGQLSRLPSHSIKLDRSFVADLPGNINTSAVTEAIISMARRLGRRVIAEGVETESQLSFLRQQRCDVYQGFLHSRPLTVEEATEQLAKSAV